MTSLRSLRSLLACCSALITGAALAQNSAALQRTEFLADPPPTISSHASTICEAKDGLVAAWFGGTAERQRDVVIWFSRFEKGAWTRPAQVASGDEDGDEQWACWNPVLVQPKKGPLLLYYKVGPSPSDWWGRLMTSEDGGVHWSKSKRLPRGIIGPVRNKPVALSDDIYLCGASDESSGWRVHMETVRQPGGVSPTWSRTPELNSPLEFGAIQPTILVWPDLGIQILCRTRQKVLSESWSVDGGKTWSRMRRTDIPNPNSAVDAVMLKDGRALLVYNPTTDNRHSLGVAIIEGARKWHHALNLEDDEGEYSYPAVIQTSDGQVHITYTWKREKIKHVVLDPSQLK
jgi:predicted neuraminidase